MKKKLICLVLIRGISSSQGTAPVRCIVFLFLILLVFSESNGQFPGNSTKKGDAHAWVEQHFAQGKIPPFSFVYGGKHSSSFIKEWKFLSEKQPENLQGIEKYLFTYREPKSGLVVQCTVLAYEKYKGVEWILKFSNTASRNSSVLEKVQVIDRDFTAGKNGFFALHRIKGSKGGKDDFKPSRSSLVTGDTIRLTPAGGRSSDDSAFPFFNLHTSASTGFLVAIGWTGKWYADICQINETTLSLKSGMERMRLMLYPEEEIRTPRICLLFWEGDDLMTGHNQFRKFVLAHKTRSNSLQLPLAISLSPNSPSPPCNGFFGCLSDTFALAKIAMLKEYDIVPDVCWMDAGWYRGGGDNWQILGNWNVEEKRFPDGLRPVADAIHALGSKFLLWFEPERMVEGTQFALEHENWLLKRSGNKKNIYTGRQDYIFNLGLRDARLWLTNYISNIIEKEGVDYYRQDFNLDPQPYWNANDPPDRVGMSEIRHIEGLYAFWDSLLVRFPDLIIDNCASGGRRMDLESISRSSLLWRSDYHMDEPNGLQNHTYGLNFYIPFHGTGNMSSTPYDFRSSLSSTMFLSWDFSDPEIPIDQMRKSIQEFIRLRPYYSSDYYPLTGIQNIMSDQAWLAYQLNRPEQGDGIVLAFRRENCNEESVEVKFHGIDANAFYELQDMDSGIKHLSAGQELMNGFKLSTDQKPSSLLIAYKLLR